MLSKENSPTHTSQISRPAVSSCNFELLSDIHYLLDLNPPKHYLFSKYISIKDGYNQ